MGSAGVNVPTAAAADGNPALAPTATATPTPVCQRRRRCLELMRVATPTGSAGRSWERWHRPRPAGASLWSTSSSSSPTLGASRWYASSSSSSQPGASAARAQLQQAEQQRVASPPHPPTELRLWDAAAAAPVWPVAFGSLSMQGRLPRMKDAISLRPGFHTWVDGSPMHFFAVFDGHGGSHVSALCRDRMHEILAEELVREGASFLVRREHAMAGVGTSAAAVAVAWAEEAEEELSWCAALVRAFHRIDALAALSCTCGCVLCPRCRCPVSVCTGFVGSTTVVAVLARNQLVVANCGDSRAVLCRGPAGTPPLPLSYDHKPTRPDELARIQAVSGQVVFSDAAHVRWVLAMSRALGDRLLRPEVISEPEITITERKVDDQCLILASDGMWDVMSNATACHLARQCLEDGNTATATTTAVVGHEAEERCSRAAMVLARLAIARRTDDNLSIIVIDLKQRE